MIGPYFAQVPLSSTMKAVAFAVAAILPGARGWTDRWDYSQRFAIAGHAQLYCDGENQLASCCICKAIVNEVETQLNNTQNDYVMEVVFRISEEKKQIKYSRSEVRILDVLDDICDRLPLKLQGDSHRTKRIMSDACNGFVGEYEDELTRTFFDDFTPAKDRMCGGTLQVCSHADKRLKHDDL
ncbi:hypothetical protein CCR75_008556 [Bremia lactucae]|uniref:Saposin B-type domain-containing protein n=1 Tax=Bremia lactucae TaxID=4779 RepID=A0A976FQS7_BRELC|nr:hypothetical protein CCR75_008556 [Bremia lactucae]